MTLPVDVVIPHKPSRDWFFRKYCLPSIEAQNPSRIIIDDGPGGACLKRNRSFLECTSPYVFLVDDDIIVSKGHLEASIEALKKAPPEYGYTYCDWIQVPMTGCMDPPVTPAQYVHIPKFHDLAIHDLGGVDWPVVRRETFQPFDTNVIRFQSWDWSLNMKDAGYLGLKLDGFSCISFMLDRGITTGTSIEDTARMRHYVQRKHGFIP